MSLNETKLDENHNYNFKNYNLVRLDKNTRSGGVMILISDDIKFEQTNHFDNYDLQIISLKILLDHSSHFFFISWYHPPNSIIPNRDFFRTLGKLKKFILTGDLNCKSKSWYCNKENPNGESLRNLLTLQNISIVKNKKPTHYSTFRRLDILDLILTSPRMLSKIQALKVYNNELSSDHFPMSFELKISKPILSKKKKIIKINFDNLISHMENNFQIFFNRELEKKNWSTETLTRIIMKNYEISFNSNSKEVIKKVDNLNLPHNILILINAKKEARKAARKHNTPFFKNKYNLTNKILHKEIADYISSKTESKLEELSKTRASDSKFWNLLKEIETSENKTKNFPYLIVENTKIYDFKLISQAFGEHLAKIFIPYEEETFDNKFRDDVNYFCSTGALFNYAEQEDYDCDFSLYELEIALNQTKSKSAPGPDNLNNMILKNFGKYGKIFLLILFNKSYNENIIPGHWKIAKMKMIPKKPNDRHNINNYRPISLTNSMVKILERLIKNRLTEYLDSNNLITKFQSGFRANRCSIDNIFYFSQKCLLSFNKNHSTGGIVFDIEKAFDKIWHEGLFIKLHEMNIPKKMAKWIKNFLTNRTFYVSTNGHDSDLFPIKTGVPQGSILSPILFSIFIDNIPLNLQNYSNLSAILYADDLFTFFSDKNLNRIQIVLQHYLDSLELWLSKWRLKVAPHKCSYNIYSKSNSSKKTLNLKISGKKISKDPNPRYLGILLDSKLSFDTHIKALKDKCNKKMNFLRILKYKKIQTKTKITVYNAMIRSNMDFGAALFGRISEINKKKLTSIQYNCLRIILSKEYRTSHSEMISQSKIKPIFKHLNDLKSKYIKRALSNIPMIIDLKEEIDEFLRENPGKNISIFS